MDVESASSKPIKPALVSLLIGITFALYWQAHTFDFVEYDDPAYVTTNLHVHQGLSWENARWAITTIVPANWHPLTMLCYLTLSTFFGAGPAPFHIFNTVIHSMNAALLYIFLAIATRRSWPSFFVAALWAWHPLRVESVAWISEMKDVLCGFFWISCMIAYVHYQRRPSLLRYAATTACLTFALLAKPMAVTLPAVLLLLCYWPLARDKAMSQAPRNWWRARVLELIPLALLCLADMAMALFTQHNAAHGPLDVILPAARVANAMVSYISYLGKLFVPIHLAVFYPHPAVLGRGIPTTQWLLASILLLLITLAVARQRSARPHLLMGWLWFLITLLPVIGLIQVGNQSMADRYTYLPSIGLTIAVVWLLADLSRHHLQRAIPTLAAATSAALLTLSTIQLRSWQNTETLFSHANQVVSDNYLARGLLSTIYRSQGRKDLALSMAQSSVELAPNDANSHFALSLILHDLGRREQAWNQLQAAITMSPSTGVFHNDCGAMLLEQGRPDEALKEFQLAADLNPNAIDARHNLALLLLQEGRYPQAIAQWQQALLMAPHNATMTGWLGEAFRLAGDTPRAIENYQVAIAAGDHNPKWERGFAWLVATSPGTSDDQIRTAVSLANDATSQTAGDDPYSLDALAAALARSGRFDRAIQIAQQAHDRAIAKNNADLAQAIQSRIALYRAGHSYLLSK